MTEQVEAFLTPSMLFVDQFQLGLRCVLIIVTVKVVNIVE
jgi:hypothetical protein